ncbi:MAG: radical SAM protein [Lentimicrobiaceae bacterium]|nr:radical SAM protein [Lentimicrobiaceae bacterium]
MIKKIIPYKLVLFYRWLKPFFRKITRKNGRCKTSIPILHIHLADHCNLNCRGCDNFSPLSPEVFADIAVFERDCARIAQLSKGRVQEIQLLGGEPLMNPQVIDFMQVARKHFPSVNIKLVSNGVLLLKQKEAFWNACRQNAIEIVVTKYPINIDYEAIKQLAERQGVKFRFYGSTAEVAKTMQCMPLDLSGKQNACDSFLRCSSANRCVSMDNGRIYTCSLIPYIKYFNAHFGQNLPVTEDDFMDIYKAENMEEILKFLCRPMPFCRFCNQKGMIWDIGYGTSKKEISEWTGK